MRRPDPSEYPAYHEAYVALVPGSDVIGALTKQVDDMSRFLDSVKDPNFAYAPGKWTIRQILSHLVDAERVFAYRALCLARNDKTPLPAFEQDDYVTYGPSPSLPMSDLRDEYQSVRRASITLFRNLPEEAWSRRGTVNQYAASAAGLAFCIAGHELHHLKILREKYLA
jgi:DinB superfamily